MFKHLRLLILCNICQNFPISFTFHISIQYRLFTKCKAEMQWVILLFGWTSRGTMMEKKKNILSSCVLQEMILYPHSMKLFWYKSYQKLTVAMSIWHFPHMHFRAIPLNICRKLLLGICPTIFLEQKLWAFATVLCVYRVFYGLQGKETDLCPLCSIPHAHA